VGAKSADEIWGTEYDWLGCDGVGHVALFTTAGGSYPPEEFLLDTDVHDEAIEAILARPAVTTARFAPDLRPDLVNIWRLAAERGLFAYDGELYGGPYRLNAAPEVPVHVDRLPPNAIEVLRRLTLHHVRFADLTVISEQDLRGA
jgi:hypothetical protein